MKEIDNYTKVLIDLVYEKISCVIREDKISDVVSNVMKHIEHNYFKFHKYYLDTLPDNFLFTTSNNFFRTFKHQYALQGISIYSLNKNFESFKPEILKLIKEDKLSDLYYRFFSKAEVQIEGAEVKRKNLGSFFTKLVHTLNPSQHCALDNPVKDYFNLTNESFFIAFIVISDAYRKWAASNYKLINSIREEIKKVDKENLLQISKLTDLKLFDLIFRIKATP
jgi:hypothetical protein